MVRGPARRADPMRRGKREGGEQNREKEGEDGPHMLMALTAPTGAAEHPFDQAHFQQVYAVLRAAVLSAR